MQPEIRFESDYQSIIIRLKGKASFQHVVLYLKSLLDHHCWNPGLKVLVDCREISIRHLTTQTIYDIAELFKLNTKRIGDGQWAFMMKNKVDYGLARMWQMLTEDYVDFSNQIFLSFEEAREWLELPEELFQEPDQDRM